MKVRILSYTTSDGVKHPLDPPVVIEECCVHVQRAENHQIEYVESCGAQYIDTGINPANALRGRRNITQEDKMPLVQCQHTDCIYCNIAGGFECKAAEITIGEEWDEGCSGYEDYRDQPDYQNEYWIAVKTKSGEAAKAKVYRGKRIEYKGRVFYTSDRLDYKCCLFTDAETGYGCGAYALLEDRLDRICEQAAKHPKVETLPEAEWTSGGYELVKEDHHE